MRVDNASLAPAASRAAVYAAPGDAFYHDAGLATTVIKVMDTRADVTISVMA